MLINCPNCNASYEVNPDVIPENGRKLRCSNCGEVFWCNPHDAENPARKLDDNQKEPTKESDNTAPQDKVEPYFEEQSTVDSNAAADFSQESQPENYSQDSDDEEKRSWAETAKMRANKTANVFNEYMLKNSYVFEGNIPSDINFQLEILK